MAKKQFSLSHVKYILALVAFALLFAPNTAIAITEKGSPNSFLDYSPHTSEYSSALHPVVESIRECQKLIREKQVESAKHKLSITAQEIKKHLESLPRGYHHGVFTLKGLIEELQGNPLEAAVSYRASLALKSNNSVTLFRLANILIEQKRYQDSLPLLRELLWRSQTHSHEIRLLFARSLIALDNKERAYEQLLEAKNANGNFQPVLKQLVQTRAELIAEESDIAVKTRLQNQQLADLNTIVQLNPNDRDAALALIPLIVDKADPLFGTDSLNKAEALAKRFADNSKFKDSELVRVLFDVQVKKRDFNSAEDTITRGLKQTPDSTILKNAQRQLELEKSVEEKLNAARSL